jgi:putative transposase
MEVINIRRAIDEIYTKWPFFGYRKVHVKLLQSGFKISAPTVLKHMQEMGIQAIYPRQKTSKPNIQNKVYPYLLKNVEACKPNHIWGVDITYVPLRNGWMYLVAYMDWYSRYVVSWEIDHTLEIGFVLSALNRALQVATPEILNSDQGSHFTSPKHTAILLEKSIKISMDGRGRAMDNIFTERLWRSIKYENIYINDYNSPREARRGIAQYFDEYNNERPHQSLGYKTPEEVYKNKF